MAMATVEPFTAIFEADGEELWRGRVTYVEQLGRGEPVTVIAPVTDPPGEPFRPSGGQNYSIGNGDFDDMILTVKDDVG